MRRIISITALLLVLGLVVASLVLFVQQRRQKAPSVSPLPSASSVPQKTPQPTVSKVTPQVSANITVTNPTQHAPVSLPFQVTGEARVFENQLAYRVTNCKGTIYFQGSTYAQSPDVGQYGPYAVTVEMLPAPQGTTGCVEVFSYAPKDGAEINNVSVPVTFNLSPSTRITAYFSKEGASNDCVSVYPLTRYTMKTTSVARRALDALLVGPAPYEKKMAIVLTSIPELPYRNLLLQMV